MSNYMLHQKKHYNLSLVLTTHSSQFTGYPPSLLPQLKMPPLANQQQQVHQTPQEGKPAREQELERHIKKLWFWFVFVVACLLLWILNVCVTPPSLPEYVAASIAPFFLTGFFTPYLSCIFSQPQWKLPFFCAPVMRRTSICRP